MTGALVYCMDGHLHLVAMPYSEEALREMAEQLELLRNWMVTGRFKHYEVPLHHAQRIVSMTLVLDHDVMFTAVERSLSVS